MLDSDLLIDGPGHNAAFGHVVLDLHTLSGVVTLSGGTGTFTYFHAGPIKVTCPAFPDCSWDGPYWTPDGSNCVREMIRPHPPYSPKAKRLPT
jgi:hypothetical protein